MKFYWRNLIVSLPIMLIHSPVPICSAEDQKQPSGYEIYEKQFATATREPRLKHSSNQGKHLWLFNEPVEIAGATSPEDAFQKFLKQYGKEKGVPESLDGFQRVRRKPLDSNDETNASLSYQQVFNGLPVFDSGFGASII